MKRRFALAACLCAAAISMTACGASNENTAASTAKETSGDQVTNDALVCSIDQDGTKIEMHADAQDDRITSITQITTVDTSQYTDEEKKKMDAIVSDAKKNMGKIDGVEYSLNEADGIYTETIKMDTKDHLKEIVAAELLQVKAVNSGEEVEYLSLSSIRDSIKEAGWTIEQ